MRQTISIVASSLWVLVSLAQASTSATNFAVGNCEPGLTSYATISQAVNAVPSGATIFVCPGNYPEQVTITQPLTLQGVKIGDADAAVIVQPTNGWGANTTDVFGSAVAAQILTQNTTQVTINNLVVDGNPGGDCVNALLIGIFYEDASGTINHAVTRNQTSRGCGIGISLQSQTGTVPAVTVENSSVHGFDNVGIEVISSSGASVTANIVSNFVTGGRTGIGLGSGSSGTISNNTVEGSGVGIEVSGNATAKGNKVVGTTQYGIWVFQGTNNSVQSNAISNSAVGVDVGCGLAGNTVTSNAINEATTGIANSPNTGNTITPNSYFGVAAVVNPCQ